ncbi:MAG: hypothetical protein ACOCXT_04475 [Candidatus Dojkabacteria bacterium]
MIQFNGRKYKTEFLPDQDLPQETQQRINYLTKSVDTTGLGEPFYTRQDEDRVTVHAPLWARQMLVGDLEIGVKANVASAIHGDDDSRFGVIDLEALRINRRFQGKGIGPAFLHALLPQIPSNMLQIVRAMPDDILIHQVPSREQVPREHILDQLHRPILMMDTHHHGLLRAFVEVGHEKNWDFKDPILASLFTMIDLVRVESLVDEANKTGMINMLVTSYPNEDYEIEGRVVPGIVRRSRKFFHSGINSVEMETTLKLLEYALEEFRFFHLNKRKSDPHEPPIFGRINQADILDFISLSERITNCLGTGAEMHVVPEIRRLAVRAFVT